MSSRRNLDLMHFWTVFDFRKTFGRRYPNVLPSDISSVQTDGYCLHWCTHGAGDQEDASSEPLACPSDAPVPGSPSPEEAPPLANARVDPTHGMFRAGEVIFKNLQKYVFSSDDPGRASHQILIDHPPTGLIRSCRQLRTKPVPYQPGKSCISATVGVLQHERLIKSAQSALEAQKRRHPTVLEAESALAAMNVGRNALSVEDWKVYIRGRSEYWDELYDFYAEEEHLRWRYAREIREQQFVANLAHAMRGYQPGKIGVLFFGNAHFNVTTRGHPPIMGIGLARELSQHMVVVQVDEFGTSKHCMITTSHVNQQAKERLIKETDLKESNIDAFKLEVVAAAAAKDRFVNTDAIVPLEGCDLIDPVRAACLRAICPVLPYRTYGKKQGKKQRLAFRIPFDHQLLHSRATAVYRLKYCEHCHATIHRDTVGMTNIFFIGHAMTCLPPYTRPKDFCRRRRRSPHSAEEDHSENLLYWE